MAIDSMCQSQFDMYHGKHPFFHVFGVLQKNNDLLVIKNRLFPTKSKMGIASTQNLLQGK